MVKTPQNKYEYIELMKDWLTRRQFEPAISHLIEGFTAHMPTADLAYFSLQEVQVCKDTAPCTPYPPPPPPPAFRLGSVAFVVCDVVVVPVAPRRAAKH